ncbi:DUF4132 domain-containing protein [Actinomadura sp. WAC 06369]|uniref:DUF4132 domain-containing protein n=1 Tax=Actinomadura sp. WAC 06369 TaxID=2203193 RepID=UPI000F781F3B|nr:DUF4132 domain-containing protein [Actinomadura sp. WAC 06369]
MWAPGERERWADAPGYRPERLGYGRYDEELARAVKQYRRRNASPQQEVVMFLHAPDDMVGPLLPAWTPPAGLGRVPEWTRPLVARHGAGVRDHAVRAARANPAGAGGLLVPFRDAEVAALMAEWLDRRPAARTHVRAWFDRHGAEAARLLVPAALAAPGAERGRAERALRFVAARTGDASVVEAARGYGDAAVGAVRAFLADTPFVGVPGRAPRPPAWADPAALPQVPLRGRAAALPAGAVTSLVTMLMIADADPVFDGVRPAAAACDPVSLAEFAWALFERWLDHGAPPRHAWAMASLGLLGDDETVRRLVPLIRDWPGEGLHHRAAAGLDVLAALGTPVALLHLHGLTRGRGYPGVKARARELFHQWAARAGVPPERLAERLVPGYDLDAEGGMTLDYGPRRFRAGFDERLEPYVADGSGRRLAAPPEPGTRDDPELAAAARRRFTAMKAEVRTASAYLVERLEKAMARRYAWTPDEFRALFAEHPIVRHIARRLVWTAGGAAFRLAEDGTLADVHDDAFVPPAGAAVRVAHPLDLGDDLARWRATFDDYELDQPFHQLHRPVHLVTENERAAGRIRRFDGLAVHHRRFRAMEHRGWERAKGRAGMDERFSRRHPGGLAVGLELEWEFAAEEENCDRWRVRELTIDAPDAALASEALADVVRLIGPRRIAAARRP